MKSRVLKFLLVCVSLLLALGEMPPAAVAAITFDYDCGSHETITYDHASLPTFDYDSHLTLLADESENQNAGVNHLLVSFAKFLAADTKRGQFLIFTYLRLIDTFWSWRVSYGWNIPERFMAQGEPEERGPRSSFALGDGDDDEMDRGTFADGHTRLCKPFAATTSKKGWKEMTNMTISRTDPFLIRFGHGA